MDIYFWMGVPVALSCAVAALWWGYRELDLGGEPDDIALALLLTICNLVASFLAVAFWPLVLLVAGLYARKLYTSEGENDG